ncbi:MAG: TrkA family potassium uptake protein [Chloroflexi bacterium]|nr:TrkA family potassium uptake protein [Chloroflexota bacterium]
MKQQVVVIGLGRFGSSVARELSELGYDVLAIDRNMRAVNEASGFVAQAIQADVTDEDALLQLGVKNFDIAIVGIGSDVQSSILVTVLLKRFGIGTVIARAQSELHAVTLEKVGADRVVFPEHESGIRIAHSLANPDVQDYMELAPNFGVSKIRLPKTLVGKSLEQAELDPEGKFGIVVLALRRGDQIILDPDATEVLQDGDILVLAGRDEGLERLQANAVKV